MGKAFEKQIKTIEDQREKQINALKNLKPKEQTKPIEDKSNNKSKSTIISNKLINERKTIMSQLYDSVDYNSLKCEYMGPTKDEYKDSKKLFNKIKISQIKFSEVNNKENEFLNNLNNVRIGKKLSNKKKRLITLKNFYKSKEEVINFFRDCIEILSDANYDSKHSETKGTDITT